MYFIQSSGDGNTGEKRLMNFEPSESSSRPGNVVGL